MNAVGARSTAAVALATVVAAVLSQLAGAQIDPAPVTAPPIPTTAVHQTPPSLACRRGQRPADPVRIVVMGSTIARGAGATTRSAGWAGRYARYLRRRRAGDELFVVAAGGSTTFSALPPGTRTRPDRPPVDEAYNIHTALGLKPDAIVLSFTSNDGAYGYPAEETLANLRTIVRTANRAGVEVWVTTTYPRPLEDIALRRLQVQVRDAVPATFGDHALDFWTRLAAPNATLLPQYDSGDEVHHPNDLGHRIMFGRVVRAHIPSALFCRKVVAIFNTAVSRRSVAVRFWLSLPAAVRMRIRSPDGRRKTVRRAALPAGVNTLRWNRRIGARPAAPGTYRLTLIATRHAHTRTSQTLVELR